MRSPSTLTALALLLVPPLHAATRIDPGRWCGTTPEGFAIAAAIQADLHRRLDRERRRNPEPKATKAPVGQAGNIALIEDDGSILLPPNAFDLDGRGLQLDPLGRGYRMSLSSASVGGALGERLALGDDDTTSVSLGKGFRFFGKTYRSVFVNSDGNLTFGQGDEAAILRDERRLVSGPPRIAAYFADLDPSRAVDGGGVYIAKGKTQVTVTWWQVPDFGGGTLNTFQVSLHKTGSITIVFGDVSGFAALVGVGPGGGSALDLVDLSAELQITASGGTVAERFAIAETLSDLGIAQAFFSRFADNYDHLIAFLDFPRRLTGAFAYELNVKNEVRGIGLEVFDGSGRAGSHGRLRSFVQMGQLEQYPADPEVEVLGTNSTLDILGQEAGHRWLAFLRFRDDQRRLSEDLLGRDLAHWSFYFNSESSDMEGNEIQERGNPGQQPSFETTGATSRYNQLDQYAMGLRGADEVDDFWYVVPEAGSNPDVRTFPPRLGIVFYGSRVDVDIRQVVAAEGPRQPAAADAPHTFNMAFILVSRQGQAPSQGSLDKIERIRAAWEPYFTQAVDYRGAVDTTLRSR